MKTTRWVAKFHTMFRYHTRGRTGEHDRPSWPLVVTRENCCSKTQLVVLLGCGSSWTAFKQVKVDLRPCDSLKLLWRKGCSQPAAAAADCSLMKARNNPVCGRMLLISASRCQLCQTCRLCAEVEVEVGQPRHLKGASLTSSRVTEMGQLEQMRGRSFAK